MKQLNKVLGGYKMADEFSQFGGKQSDDEFSQFGGKGLPQPQANPSLFPRILGDILSGAAQFSQGVESAPYNIAKTFGASPAVLSSRFMPQPTNIDFSRLFGVPNPNMLDKSLQGVAQYLPALLTGGSTTLGQTAAGSAFGALQSDNPVLGATLGAIIPAAAKGVGALAKPIASSLSNIPAYLKSSQTLSSLRDILSPSSIANIENQGKSLYKPLMEKAGNSNIITDPGKSAYLNVIKSDPLTTTSAASKLSTQDFLDNPNFNNAHKLQDALEDRIREFNIMEQRAGALPTEESNARQSFIDARNALMSDIHSGLSNIDPALSNAYRLASENWAINVEPWRMAAKQLRDLGAPEDVTLKKIVSSFSRTAAKAQPISSNMQAPINPIPQEIQPFLSSLRDALRGQKALKNLGKTALGTAIVGSLGAGINDIKSLL